jgi:hypothetical protein
MSLNADVMDDIDDGSVIDHDIIKQPSAVKPNNEPVTIIAKTEDVAQDVTELSEADKQTLPAMDVSFNVVKDGVNKVIELQDVENDIVAQEAINRSNAELVNEVFPGLLGSHVCLEEFTHTPSKTNFLYVKKHMQIKIALEQENIINDFNNFIAKPLQDAKAVMLKLTEDYIEAAVDRFSSLFYQFKDLESKLKANKNIVVSCKGQFVNLLNTDLFSIKYSEIDLDIPTKALLDTATANLKQLFESRPFKSFILGSLEGKPITSCLTRDSMVQYGDSSISVLDLCKIFSSSVVADNINSLKDIVNADIDVVNNISDQYAKESAIDNFVTVNDFIINNNDKVQNMIKSVQDICKLVLGINNLTLNTKPLLDFYSKM